MKTAALLSLSAAGALALTSENPYATTPNWYVNPAYQAELDSSIATATGDVKDTLTKMRSLSSAYWIDVKAKIKGTDTNSLQGILTAAQKTGDLVTLILYDLPNRDCAAKASNGEICCTYLADGRCDFNAQGDCADGLKEYEDEYVTPFAEVLSQFPDVPTVVIIEPDSLPNIATNSGMATCGNSATTAAYTKGIPFAINTVAAKAPHVTMYLDAAHGGWLGWDDNVQAFTKLFAAMDVKDKLRGFATNVANYQPVGKMCPWAPNGLRNDYCLGGAHQSEECCSDPCSLESQYDPGNNEMNYAQTLYKVMGALADYEPHMLIDTGRNGVAGMRSDCANWCNARGAGVGSAPTTSTGQEFIDAFFWLKTPGESDGCTETLPDGTKCPRYDSMCGSPDSIGSKAGEPRSPEAGAWFDYQIKMLAANAHL